MEFLRKLFGPQEVNQSPARLALVKRTQDEFDVLGSAGSDMGSTLTRAVEAATYRAAAVAQIMNSLPAEATDAQVRAAEAEIVRLMRPVHQIVEHIKGLESLISECEPGR